MSSEQDSYEGCLRISEIFGGENETTSNFSATPRTAKRGKRQCTFKEERLADTALRLWLTKGESAGMARCKVCPCKFPVKSDGTAAIRGHMQSSKNKEPVHAKNKNECIANFVEAGK